MTTEILGLDEVTAAQSDKFLTHNEALRQLEGKIVRALSRTNSGPPVSPSNGDVYIVDSATGDWSSASVNDYAHYYGSAWNFFTPIEGNRVWINDEDRVHIFDGTDWDTFNLAGVAAFTQGSVVFADSSGNFTQDNSNFFWDDTNDVLGLGTSSPFTSGRLTVQKDGATEQSLIRLVNDNQTIGADAAIDADFNGFNGPKIVYEKRSNYSSGANANGDVVIYGSNANTLQEIFRAQFNGKAAVNGFPDLSFDVINATSTAASEVLGIRSRKGTGSAADDDYVSMNYFLDSDTTEDAIECQIRAIATDVTHATRKADLAFFTPFNGVIDQRFRMTAAGIALWGKSTAAGIGPTVVDENSGEVGPGYINLFLDDTASTKQVVFGRNGSEVGNITTDATTTAYNTSSGSVLKTGFRLINNGCDLVQQFQAGFFEWVKTGETDAGFLAEQIYQAYPFAVTRPAEEGGSWFLDYGKLTVPLTAAVNELITLVSDLQTRVTQLEATP